MHNAYKTRKAAFNDTVRYTFIYNNKMPIRYFNIYLYLQGDYFKSKH